MKRIVTYLYEYHNGKKGNNIGFLKVDLRGTECRVQLHIQAPGRETEKGKVYLVVQNSPAEGILLGEIMLQKGSCEMTWRFSRLRIQGSDYELSQVMGAGIIFPSGRYLASSWVEEPSEELLRGRFRIWEKPKEDGRMQRNIPAQPLQAAANVIPMQDAIQMKNPRSQFWNIRRPDELSLENDGLPGEDGSVKIANRQETDDTESQVGANPKEPMEAKEHAKTDAKGQMEAKEHTKTDEEGQMEAKDHAETDEEGQVETKPKDHAETDGEGQVEAKPKEHAKKDTQEMPYVGRSSDGVQMTAESIIPFGGRAEGKGRCTSDSETAGSCMKKIDINYIKKLPKRNWYLCNNSFLIHGFFNYHYLVLKEVQENGMKKLYLGVPGIYERPERAMALLFGFSEFAAAQPKDGGKGGAQGQRILGMPHQEDELEEVQDGTFGYWFCLLDT